MLKNKYESQVEPQSPNDQSKLSEEEAVNLLKNLKNFINTTKVTIFNLQVEMSRLSKDMKKIKKESKIVISN